MIRARDVREKCRGRVDPQVLECMIALAEAQSVLFQGLNEMAKMIDQMTNIIAANTIIQQTQKTAIDKLQGLKGISKEEDERYGDVTE